MNSELDIQQNIPLAPLTTLKVGGSADYFVEVKTMDGLKSASAWAKENKQPITVLGGGSNVLVSDQGLSGLVIKMSIEGIDHEDDGDSVVVKVGAGVVLDEFIAYSVAEGWWGLENLSAIPGSVGAAPVQNVGAYGVEVKEVIKEVEVFNLDTSELEILGSDDCQFGYRDSFFKTKAGKGLVVTGVTFVLSKTPKPVLTYRDLEQAFPEGVAEQSEIRDAVVSIRGGKFPDWTKVGTAGSFFKNPIVAQAKYEELLSQNPDLPAYSVSDDKVKLPFGYVLDKVLNLKGYQEGGVKTYEKQALVLVADKGASAADIEAFAKHIQVLALEKLGLEVDWEVTKLGE